MYVEMENKLVVSVHIQQLTCPYCKYTAINPTANLKSYHKRTNHPEMKRNYTKSYSSNSSAYSTSNSSRPPAPLLLEDAQPSNTIIGKKRPIYNDEEG
jgi:hypothetical protein